MGEFFPSDPVYRGLRIAGLCAVLGGTVLLSRFSGEQLAEEITEVLASGESPAQDPVDNSAQSSKLRLAPLSTCYKTK